jgi:ABC-type phosphate/phosphonate transport system permease subunit
MDRIFSKDNFPASAILLTLWVGFTVAVSVGTGAELVPSALVGFVLAAIFALPVAFFLGSVVCIARRGRETFRAATRKGDPSHAEWLP